MNIDLKKIEEEKNSDELVMKNPIDSAGVLKKMKDTQEN